MNRVEYIGSTERSKQIFERAKALMPGGVNSPVRAFSAVGGAPLVMERGAGPYIWDVDGNQYIDHVMSWGPLIHGHAFPPVLDAIHQAAARGTSFGALTELEVRLAELLIAAVPTVEMVRFVNSGTEATMSALRLARGYTGKDLIIKFAGNYHGHADALLAQAGSGNLTLGIPGSPGVPASTVASTIVATYNDIPTLERIFLERRSDVAAVIVEPVAGNMGVIAPAPGFLESVRSLTREHQALLICDEVITGFRVAYGGAQSVFDLDPDITTLGKIIGGGLPVGAYGGRKEIMEQMAPVGPVYQAGTLSGNPLAMAAGIASVEALGDIAFYERLASRTTRLVEGLKQAAENAGVSVTVNGCTGMLTAFFYEGPVTTLEEAQSSDVGLHARFFHAMLERGVYLPPSQFEAWMLSSAHTDGIVDRTIEVALDAFSALV